MAALFNRITPEPTVDTIKTIVTCLTMEQIEEYMRDVGITITQTPFGSTLHQSTIDNDADWIERKIGILFQHLHSKAIGE